MDILRFFFVGIASIACALLIGMLPSPISADTSADCPNGGTVRFGVEPFEAASRITPAYDALVKLLGVRLGCAIELSIPSSYNAEIEADHGRRRGSVALIGPGAAASLSYRKRPTSCGAAAC